MKVTIYSTSTCPYCKQLKDYLSSRGVDFEEKVVDRDASAREEMVRESGGFMGVPFVVMERDGRTERVIGFDKNKIDDFLEF